MSGNPIDGLNLYGVFKSSEEASDYASLDKHLPPDWWVIGIYAI
jgi:hypothetical protein